MTGRAPAALGAAWAVHALTASGAVLALLALQAVLADRPVAAYAWLGVALLVDALDGPLARRLRVAEALPRFDGAALDLIVDYLTYVFVPAVMVWHWALVPDGWDLPAAAWILLTSLHLFCKRDLKGEDQAFLGFPSLWNAVVFGLVFLAVPPAAGLVAITLLGALTFAPIRFPHPVRTEGRRGATVVFTALWTVASLGLMGAHPAQPGWATALWLAAAGYFLLISVAGSKKEL